MTEQQKKFIEDNIDLIEDNRWTEFFDKCVKTLLSHSVGGLLYESGIDFMKELDYVPNRAFQESNIQAMVIPDGVTSIGYFAFCDCANLTSVTIPNSVKSIEYGAFRDCSSLTSIIIPDSVINIGEYAFYGCRGLTSVTIREGVTNIEKEAFRDCTGLTSIVIPNGVTSIEDYAFANCNGLTSVVMSDSVTSIGDKAFSSCGKLEIKYDGTTAEWKHLIGNNRRVFEYTTYTCDCIDGVVKKSR